MNKYVCKGGCGGVSDVPGICQEKTCPNFGKPLEMEKCENCESEDSKNKNNGGCCDHNHK